MAAADLGTFGGFSSSAQAINDHGVIVGRGGSEAGSGLPLVWDQGQPASLPTQGFGGAAADINNAGVIVGNVKDKDGAWRVARWRNRVLVDLGPGFATDINEAGDIVYSKVVEGAFVETIRRADGTEERFPRGARPVRLTESGIVLVDRTVRYPDGRTVELQPPEDHTSTWVTRVSDDGRAVGWASPSGKGASAVAWDRAGRPTMLPAAVHSFAGRANGTADGFTPDGGIFGTRRAWIGSGLVFVGPSIPVVWGASSGNGEPPECITEADFDRDGLDRQAEIDLGIEPCIADTDGDAILDGFELLGIDVVDGRAQAARGGRAQLDLPAWGANPKRRDVFVELEWMRDQASLCVFDRCGLRHSHRPSAAMLRRVIDAYAAAPVSNFDRSRGISLHIDAGTGMTTDGEHWRTDGHGGPVAHHDHLFARDADTVRSGADGVVRSFGDPRPDGDAVFHYALLAHRLAPDTYASGQSFFIPGDTLAVTYGDSSATETALARTLMHELGHNLGLRHGGGDDVGYKPSYLSVMNYNTSRVGLRVHGKDGVLDYSRFLTSPLDRDALDERIGVTLAPGVTQPDELPGAAFGAYGVRVLCAGGAVETSNSPSPLDFDCDGRRDGFGVARVLTDEGAIAPFEILRGSQDDWAELRFDSIGEGGSASADADALPEPEEPDIATPSAATVTGPGRVEVPHGTPVTLRYAVAATGTETTEVAIDANGRAKTVTLAPGQSHEVVIELAAVREPDSVTAVARPSGNPVMGGSHTAEILPIDVEDSDPDDLLTATMRLLAAATSGPAHEVQALAAARSHLCLARDAVPTSPAAATLGIADALDHLNSVGATVPGQLAELLAGLSETLTSQTVEATVDPQHHRLASRWLARGQAHLAASRTTAAAYDFARAAGAAAGDQPQPAHVARDIRAPHSC